MFAFDHHCFSHRLWPAGEDAVFIPSTASSQNGIDLFQILGLRYRYQMIAPEVSTFAFDSALFVTFAGSTEAGLEAPVGAEGNKSNGLLPPLPAQDLSNS